jgi:hypothetical protein
MPEDIQKPEERAPEETEHLSAEHDAKVRAGVYVALAATTLAVLIALGYLNRSERIYAAGTALGLEEVALKLEQGRPEAAEQKLREVAPELRAMGWDTSPEVDAALQRIRKASLDVYLEAVRYLSGRKLPQEEELKPDTRPSSRPQPRVYPSAI